MVDFVIGSTKQEEPSILVYVLLNEFQSLFDPLIAFHDEPGVFGKEGL